MRSGHAQKRFASRFIRDRCRVHTQQSVVPPTYLAIASLNVCIFPSHSSSVLVFIPNPTCTLFASFLLKKKKNHQPSGAMLLTGELQFWKLRERSMKNLQTSTVFEPVPPVYTSLAVLYLIFNPQLIFNLVQSV